MYSKKLLGAGIALMMALGMTGCSSGGAGGGGAEQAATSAYTKDDLQGIWKAEDNIYRLYVEGEDIYYIVSYSSGSSSRSSGDLDRLEEGIVVMSDEEYKIEKDKDGNLTLVGEDTTYRHVEQTKKDLVDGTWNELDFCKFGIDPPYSSELIENWLFNTAGAGNTYVIIPIVFESTCEKDMDMNNVAAKVIFDDKYEYNAKMWHQTKGNLQIAPLAGNMAYLAAEVPVKVVDQGMEFRVEIAFNENLGPEAWDYEDLKDGFAQYDYLFVADGYSFTPAE